MAPNVLRMHCEFKNPPTENSPGLSAVPANRFHVHADQPSIEAAAPVI